MYIYSSKEMTLASYTNQRWNINSFHKSHKIERNIFELTIYRLNWVFFSFERENINWCTIAPANIRPKWFNFKHQVRGWLILSREAQSTMIGKQCFEIRKKVQFADVTLNAYVLKSKNQYLFFENSKKKN